MAPKCLEEIIKAANKCGSVVLIDEAYYLYYHHTAVKLINRYPNLVITRTFSKALGSASCRLGFVIGNKAMIDGLKKVRPVYEANAFAVLLANAVLDNLPIVRSNVKNTMEGKSYLEEELGRMGIKYYRGFANFVVIDVGSYEKSCKIVRNMKKSKILIGGGYRYPCLRNCIRVTTGPKSVMKVFLRELKKVYHA